MTANLPVVNASYLGPITNTKRWTDFRHRPDDIFICTPPKCGTTWTQAICAMLVFGNVDHGIRPGAVSPWLDAGFTPIEDELKKLEAQSHRRFIKTHTPLDGIPYVPSCAYVVVCRDPRDAFFSTVNHRDNMTNEELAQGMLPQSPTAFLDWLARERKPESWDVVSLEALTHFFMSYWRYRELDNVHMFHYSDMKRDLEQAITAMAAALDIEIDEAQIAAYAKAASFDSMKRNSAQFAPFAGDEFWKSESGFFASGSNQQWKDKLSAAELAAFDARIAELLPVDAAHWLLNGNG